MTASKKLLSEAKKAMKKAYAPYSRFKVGVSILAGGAIFSGCNVENVSYGEGDCAETAAIGAMIMGGKKSIDEILVVSSGKTPCPPCGGCRQRIAEFSNKKTKIHISTQQGLMSTHSMEDLLPGSFKAANLK